MSAVKRHNGQKIQKIDITNLNGCSQSDLNNLHQRTYEFLENQSNILIYSIVFSIIGTFLLLMFIDYIKKIQSQEQGAKLFMERIMQKMEEA